MFRKYLLNKTFSQPTCHEPGMTFNFKAIQFVQKRPQDDLSDAVLPFTCKKYRKIPQPSINIAISEQKANVN